MVVSVQPCCFRFHCRCTPFIILITFHKDNNKVLMMRIDQQDLLRDFAAVIFCIHKSNPLSFPPSHKLHPQPLANRHRIPPERLDPWRYPPAVQPGSGRLGSAHPFRQRRLRKPRLTERADHFLGHLIFCFGSASPQSRGSPVPAGLRHHLSSFEIRVIPIANPLTNPYHQ